MTGAVVAVPMRSLRRYKAAVDLPWMHGLWRRALPARWSLPVAELGKRIGSATLILVAMGGGVPVGFCAVGYGKGGGGGGTAGLLTIVVEPSWQRQGMGTLLLGEVERVLRARGIGRLNVGFGDGGNYFWPGLPAEADAWGFLARQGWQRDEGSFDLVQELAGYRTPAWARERLDKVGIRLRVARLEDGERVERFEGRWFPAWAGFFRNAAAAAEWDNMLLALDARGEVVGTALVKAGVAATWDADVGVRYGTLNVLGVADDRQGTGIGIGLAAGAMELLQTRGCSRCYIQWTGLVDWYGKLGATVWAEYQMGWKLLG